MRLSSITEMAAKQFCPNCGKTMAANHYWYKGGWRCKGGGKSADGVAGAALPQASGESRLSGAPTRNDVPPGFDQKIAALPFGATIKLKDGTDVRYLGGGKDASAPSASGETLYPVRVASGPDAGQLLLVQPGEMDL